ncbi:GNAT family N-acetyltransferase [Fulvivirgaceae bacterium PWU4]|uniref:GNAT family N-acetyltransferase n=1 Tax=Chryseosolibacter histidini TaxID=2782349 RepID=A0AAP2DQG5_9BACT|nr:GNAT family N-acetyltransferase [Chryseosolibacter histidini]MBT1699117.1 GNAT family N-acetyltransferase [Chryseosolibacter histidini]
MSAKLSLEDITIRTELRPGDIGYITYLHGSLYSREYNYGLSFEAYVAKGMLEFYEQYNPATNRVWVCEHQSKMIGFLLLMNRGTAAQLRYFLILPEYRGIGLGKKLMDLYMDFLRQCQYQLSYLWTTHELYTAAHLYQKYGFHPAEEVESSAFGKTLKEKKYILSLEVARSKN